MKKVRAGSSEQLQQQDLPPYVGPSHQRSQSLPHVDSVFQSQATEEQSSQRRSKRRLKFPSLSTLFSFKDSIKLLDTHSTEHSDGRTKAPAQQSSKDPLEPSEARYQPVHTSNLWKTSGINGSLQTHLYLSHGLTITSSQYLLICLLASLSFKQQTCHHL